MTENKDNTLLSVYENFYKDIWVSVMNLCRDGNADGLIIGEAMEAVQKAREIYQAE